MYTAPEREFEEHNPDRKRASVSQDNARDIVEAIDELIATRIVESRGMGMVPFNPDMAEIIKRKITDYLLVTDPRAGVFRKPE